MTCSLCGAPDPCVHTRRNTAVRRDAEILDDTTQSISPAADEARSSAEQKHWRQEVISRVRQHRARRRRFDPTASMQFDFPAEAALAVAPGLAETLSPILPSQADDAAKENNEFEQPLETEPPRQQARKVIRFPRYATNQPAGSLKPAGIDRELEFDLVHPAVDGPRILEAPEVAPVHAPEPEQMELLPSFADIRLEPMETCRDESEDLPPQAASLRRRFGCGLVDGAIVMLALTTFAVSFSWLAGDAPRTRATLLCSLAVAAILWLLFQYLFLAYGRGTPGMRAARLELLAFDGKRASAFARRGRALATTLSGVSVGLGFVWALVDEDSLGWHDRISQTYLRSVHRTIG